MWSLLVSDTNQKDQDHNRAREHGAGDDAAYYFPTFSMRMRWQWLDLGGLVGDVLHRGYGEKIHGPLVWPLPLDCDRGGFSVFLHLGRESLA